MNLELYSLVALAAMTSLASEPPWVARPARLGQPMQHDMPSSTVAMIEFGHTVPNEDRRLDDAGNGSEK